MRLVRIEADRFGRIDGRSLGDLSPRLTVVLGPNEAGKSSFTALVRHVLYGFPTPSDQKDPAYVSASGGKRQGRLVFSDDQGEWVVERVEGPRGGTVSVRTLSGPDKPGLVDELTRGVSRLAYRVVFGFGLAEMQQIEQLKGKDDDLLSRLYAAGAGLTVSPPDIRSELDGLAEALWKKGGSRPAVNEARTRREEVRAHIRQLQADADAFRGESERLLGLESRLDSARSLRTSTQADAERLARAVTDVERLLGEAGAAEARKARLLREAEASRSEAEAVGQEDVLALEAADAVQAIEAGLPVFRQWLESMGDTETSLRTVEQRIGAAAEDAGWTEQQAIHAAGDAGTAAQVDAAHDELRDLRLRADMAAEARDRARAESAAAPVPAAPATRPWVLPGVVVAIASLAGAVAGLVMGQLVAVVLGAVLAVVGSAMALVRPSTVGDPHAAARLAAAESACGSAESALRERREAWAAWVRDRGLGDGSEEPLAIAARLRAAREVRVADRERAALTGSIERDRERVESFVDRVAAALEPLSAGAVMVMAPEQVADAVQRASARVSGALLKRDLRREHLETADDLERDAEEAEAARLAASEAAGRLLDEVGLPNGSLEDVRRLETEARVSAVDAADEFESLTTEVAGLRAHIDHERREDALSLLRLEETGLEERITADVRRHTVLSLASRLLGMAQERYERDRQPAVVKNAEAAFSRMTCGRYTRLTVPLGKDAIEVFDKTSAARGPEHLSRGTAEQLYLALRFGLVDQLGEVGKGLPLLMDDVLVNFSPERVRPAAEAIADLAERRQVVFFTCHPSMAGLLREVDPTAAFLEITGPA